MPVTQDQRNQEPDPVHTEVDDLREALAKHRDKRARRLIKAMHPAKLASLLETLTPEQRIAAWHQVDARSGVEGFVVSVGRDAGAAGT